MATGKDLVNVALKEVGYTEGANNSNKYGAYYGRNNEYWCAFFVSWCLEQIGIDDYGGEGASWNFALAARDRGIGTYHAKGSGYSPKLGDLYIADFNGTDWARHIGIVKEDASGGQFSSIDGNSSDAVSIVSARYVSDYCYVTPPYDGAATSELKPQREVVIEVPAGLGTVYTYMNWSAITNTSSTQYQLINEAEANNDRHYDNEGYGMVGERFALAMTSTFGAIGDYVDVYMENGRVIHGILADEKHQGAPVSWDQNPANKWGHNNGERIVEWVTNWRNHDNPPSDGCVLKVINLGNYFEYPEYANASSYTSSSETSESKPITATATMSYVGEQAGVRNNIFDGLRMKNQSNIELYIANPDGRIYKPVICDKIEWEPPKNSYAMLGFTALKDPVLDFQEGAQVIFKYRGENVFCGYVFEKSRSDGYRIKVAAYDQLRYFNNKDIYVYQDITASELLTAICKDHSVKLGGVYDTGIKLPLTVEDNTPLIDIMYNALQYTVSQGGIYCLLYDDFGQVRLDPQYWFRVPYAVNKETVQSIDYTSSINEGTFNRIKTYRDNEETGVREVYINDKSAEFSQWGVLQYTHQLEDGQDGAAMAENLIKITTNKTRSLSVKGAFGDIRVRGGSSVFVDLDLGDLLQYGYMEVSGAKHTFTDSSHTMDLDLIGGQFI